jgi:hypothetical protein
MGKSDCKRVLWELAPLCFTPSSSEKNTFSVILEDSCVRLQKMMAGLMHDDNKSCTLDELVICFFKPMVHALGQPSNVNVYVALFDKSVYVTLAKQPEQRSRDGNRSGASLKRKLSSKENSKYGNASSPSKLTPRNAGLFCMPARQLASDFMHDRNFKYFFTKLLSQRGAELLPEMMRMGGLSTDCAIVIDAEKMDDFDASSGPSVPIICRSFSSLEHVNLYNESDIALAKQLSNCIGEFDVAQTHYLRSPLLQKIAQPYGFLIDTIDTDLLMVNILQSGIAGYPNTVKVRCTLPPLKESFDFNPIKANAWISSLIGPGGADKIVQAYTLAGSDFCHGVPGQGNARFLSDFLSHRGTVTASEHFRNACMSFLSKGTRRASSTKAAGDYDRQIRSVSAQCERADYVLEYWKYTGYRDELVPSPLGRGFALKSGFIEYAEDICVETEDPNLFRCTKK